MKSNIEKMRTVSKSKRPKKAIKIPSVAVIARRYRELRQLRQRLIETEAHQNSLH